jgi:ubiquinone/menaquinone biosynthesis C-methylase UbiE
MAGHTPFPVAHAGHLDRRLRHLIQNPGRILGPHIQRGDTVLDLGCGPGFFTIPMARMVGETGRVIAVDVQEEMLLLVREAAEREGLAPRIRFHRSGGSSIGLDMPPVLSFALAFYVIHETGDRDGILSDLHRLLRPGGSLLIAEPFMVVGRKEFRETINAATRAGFTEIAHPFILLARSALLEKGREG